MIKYFVLFSIATLVSFLITPLIKSFSSRLRIFDFPSERKIHQMPIPLLGGVSIFIAFNLTTFLGILFKIEFLKETPMTKWSVIFASQLIILGIGIFDDVKNVKPSIKFLIQIAAGLVTVLFGFGIPTITNPFTGNLISLGFLSVPLTVLWVVGITNALNLLDGLDGLAAGTSFIASITIFGIAYIYQNISIALISAILAGSILGFLKYNFAPAKIFLGDSGSLLLGFLLSILSLQGVHKGATLVAIAVPILVLGLPIIETSLSMIRRFLKSIHVMDYPAENGKVKMFFFKRFSLFEGDKDHIHHRLIKLGFSQRKAVVILYIVCAVLCALAFLTVIWQNLNVSLYLIAIIAASFIGIKSLNYQELKIFKKGLLLPIFDIPLVSNRFFQAINDLIFISLSFYFSFILMFGGFSESTKALFISSIPLILGLKIISFYIAGLYKCSWRYPSVEDFIKIGKSIVLSSMTCAFLLAILFGLKSFGGIIFFILDFYLSSTFVAGSRISYQIINHYYHKKETGECKKVAIYGAGRKGFLLVRELQYNNPQYKIVGFIDDSPQKRGKSQLDLPVLGTIQELESIVGKTGLAEIIISTNKIGSDKIYFLRRFCRDKGIDIKTFELKFNNIN